MPLYRNYLEAIQRSNRTIGMVAIAIYIVLLIQIFDMKDVVRKGMINKEYHSSIQEDSTFLH